MSIINNMPNGSGSLELNGLIKEYYVYAGENISAGDLVEFVNGIASNGNVYSTSELTSIVTENTANMFYALTISDNKVLILHGHGTNYTLYGIVLEINGSVITIGTNTALNTSEHSAGRIVSGNTSYSYTISASLLPNGNVFVTHSSGSYGYPAGTVVQIQGMIINKIAYKELTRSTVWGAGITGTITLANGNVLTMYGGSGGSSSQGSMYGMVCSVNNTEIILGTDTQINSYLRSQEAFKGLLMRDGNIFYIHKDNDDIMYAHAWAVEGTVVRSIYTDTSLSLSYSAPGRAFLTLLDDDTIFITYVYNNNYVYGIIVALRRLQILKGTATALSAVNGAASAFTATYAGFNQVAVFCNNSAKINGIVCNANERVITVNTEIQLIPSKSYYPSRLNSVTLYNNNLLCIPGINTTLWGQIFDVDENNKLLTSQISEAIMETQIRKITTPKIEAVAKTAGQGAAISSAEHKDKIQVYVPFTGYNLIPDASFEDNQWNDANYSTEVYRLGSRSLYFPIGTTIVANIAIPRPIVGHKYYGRRYIKTNGNNTPSDCRFEMYAGDGEGLNWVFAWNQGNYPEWGFDSAIHEVTVINYDESVQTKIRCFNVATTADTWVDDLLLVDLTDMFGAGHEPSKEWCDDNL